MKLPAENKRIEELVKEFGKGKVSIFIRQLNGISHQSLNRLFHIDSRTNDYPGVSSDIIQAIIKAFPQVNTSWLLTGEGSMLLSKKDAKPNSELARVDFLKIMDRLFNLDALEKRVSDIESRLGLSSEPVPEDKDQSPPLEGDKKESKSPS